MKGLRIISAILLVSLMAVIFIFSSETADESTSTSGNLISAVVGFFYPEFNDLSEFEQQEFIEPFQFFVRKGAHFTVYSLLGIFSFFTFVTYIGIPFGLRFFLSSATCLIYSVSDEIHQTFVPGRSGELRDVCIDFAGSLLSIIILSLIFKNKFKGGVNMRKKELLKINAELFSRNRQLLDEIEDFKKEISDLKAENCQLTAQRDNLNSRLNSTPPLKKLEEKIAARADVTEDTAYGSAVIGQIVISAAKHCNCLTTEANCEMTKELVNLILGRTEVAKAEILKTVSSDIPLDEKKALIDEQKKSAEDYFSSVMAQTE